MSDSQSRPWYQFSLKWLLLAIGYLALAFGTWRNIDTTLGGLLAFPLIISTLVILLALLRWLIIWLSSHSFRYDDEDAP